MYDTRPCGTAPAAALTAPALAPALTRPSLLPPSQAIAPLASGGLPRQAHPGSGAAVARQGRVHPAVRRGSARTGRRAHLHATRPSAAYRDLCCTRQQGVNPHSPPRIPRLTPPASLAASHRPPHTSRPPQGRHGAARRGHPRGARHLRIHTRGAGHQPRAARWGGGKRSELDVGSCALRRGAPQPQLSPCRFSFA